MKQQLNVILISCFKICSWRSGISLTGTQRCCPVFITAFRIRVVLVSNLGFGSRFSGSCVRTFFSVLRVMLGDELEEYRLLSHPLIFIIIWSAFY